MWRESSAGQEVKPPGNVYQEPAMCQALCKEDRETKPVLGSCPWTRPHKLTGRTEMPSFEGARTCVKCMEAHGGALNGISGSRMGSSSRMPEPSLQDGEKLTRERKCREKGFKQDE